MKEEVDYVDETNLHSSALFIVNDMKLRKSNDFVPSKTDLLFMAVTQINNLKVTELRHRNKKKHDIQSLTFLMSNGAQSPPKGSYHQEP